MGTQRDSVSAQAVGTWKHGETLTPRMPAHLSTSYEDKGTRAPASRDTHDQARMGGSSPVEAPKSCLEL